MTQLDLLGELEEAPPRADEGLPERLWVGTSSFSTADWVGPFYPRDTAPADTLRHDAGHAPGSIALLRSLWSEEAAATPEGDAR